MKFSAFPRIWRQARMLTALAGLTVVVAACGGKDEPPAGTTPAPSEKSIPSSSLILQDIPEGAPETYPSLRFMPAEAQIAVGIPPVPGVEASVLPVIRAVAPDADVEGDIKEAVQDLARELGVQAETYEELAAELGIEPDGAIAVFLDFSPTVEDAIASAEVDTTTDDAASDSEVVMPELSGDTARAALEEPEEPAWATVLEVANLAKVEAAIDRAIEGDEELAALPATSAMEGDVEVSLRGDIGWFITDQHVIYGDARLVRGAARRVADPEDFRYGTPACPATAVDEAVALVFGNRLAPFMDQALPLMLAGAGDAAMPAIKSSMDQYKDAFADGEEEDPMVFTLALLEERIEFLARADMAANPGLKKSYGTATPLRLARYLPENTLAMLSLRFNEEFKQQLQGTVLPAAQASAGPNAAMAGQFIPQLGDELTVGITGAVDGLPGVYLMLGLAEPETTKGILKMFIPTDGGTDHEGTTINAVQLPAPIPLHLAFLDDFALAGTNEAEMKRIIDRYTAKEDAKVFASMEPPIDLDVPRYQAIAIQTGKLYEEATATAGAFGGDLGDSDPTLRRIAAVVREVRSMTELEGNWMKGTLTVYLNDQSAWPEPGAPGVESTETGQ